MPKTTQPTWGGRFSSPPGKDVEAFTESISFDWMLARHDIAGSIAHAKGLAKAGILTKAEAGKIERGLRAIERDIESGRFKWDPAAEDVHMNIEAALIRKIGEAGKKLHTARSRNDQVATDLRLWVRSTVLRTQLSIGELQSAPGAIGEAMIIPAQHLDVCEQMMREDDRLRPLQMRVTRHDDVHVALRE